MSHDTVYQESLQRLPQPARLYRKLMDYLMIDCGPGPRCVKLCIPINLQKGGTLLFVLGLMRYFDNYGPTAHAYLALHGSYGLIWLLKEAVFPDPNWQVAVRPCSALVSWLAVLGPYWLAPYLIISTRHEASNAVIAASSIMYALGVAIMIGSDAQKYFVLKERRGLITNGFFKRVRHPNYLGEMMIYASFASLCGRYEAWGVLAWVWLGVFMPNIMLKEARMSRYSGWAAYKAASGCLIPKLF